MRAIGFGVDAVILAAVLAAVVLKSFLARAPAAISAVVFARSIVVGGVAEAITDVLDVSLAKRKVIIAIIFSFTFLTVIIHSTVVFVVVVVVFAGGKNDAPRNYRVPDKPTQHAAEQRAPTSSMDYLFKMQLLPLLFLLLLQLLPLSPFFERRIWRS